MPLFDFACLKCGNTFEESLPFGTQKLPTCPACGSKKVEKQISPPVIHFKGSGFFKTDHTTTGKTAIPTDKKTMDKPVEKKVENATPSKSKSPDSGT